MSEIRRIYIKNNQNVVSSIGAAWVWNGWNLFKLFLQFLNQGRMSLELFNDRNVTHLFFEWWKEVTETAL